MLDFWTQNYPYNEIDYDSKFITRKVIESIRDFCKSHPDIKAFYAKGSIAHGCMLEGSDIDHIRIRTNRCLEIHEKIKLVDELEAVVTPLGVSSLKRIRENNYIRVFDRWDLLSHLPYAKTSDFEIWPKLNIITAVDNKDWQQKIIDIGDPYCEVWRSKMRSRIKDMPYNVFNEYVNIDKYSPYSFVNEMTERYKFKPFDMPFVSTDNGTVPMHPDTMDDLEISLKEVVYYRTVYPTSSFRTVYDPEWNVFYKLPFFRKITRSTREISLLDIKRSWAAKQLLSENMPNEFDFLREECYPAYRPNRPELNYIKRKLPEEKLYPWFYAIKSQCLPRQSMINICKNIINSWLYYAKQDIFLEFHTQNILFDMDENIWYRDLSDVRTMEGVCAPSYIDKVSNPELVSLIFDRTVCFQNLDHVFRYDKQLGEDGRQEIKEFITESIEYYGIIFPQYSMDFPKIKTERVPIVVPLTKWRT